MALGLIASLPTETTNAKPGCAAHLKLSGIPSYLKYTRSLKVKPKLRTDKALKEQQENMKQVKLLEEQNIQLNKNISHGALLFLGPSV